MKFFFAMQDRVTLTSVFAVAFSGLVVQFLHKLYRARTRMLKLKYQGLAMPPYHPLLGHLPFAYTMTKDLPKDAHPNYLPDMIRRALPGLGPVYYIDTWPFGPQMLVVSSPNTLHQVMQDHPLPKYHALREFLLPIADGLDIVIMEGRAWKTWRGVFNPGFSAGHLLTLTPAIVEETQKFCEILDLRQKDQKLF